MAVWYRNAGSRTYHARAEDWVQTGKAVCGADLRRPGFRWLGIVFSSKHKHCSRCLRKGAALRPKPEGRPPVWTLGVH